MALILATATLLMLAVSVSGADGKAPAGNKPSHCVMETERKLGALAVTVKVTTAPEEGTSSAAISTPTSPANCSPSSRGGTLQAAPSLLTTWTRLEEGVNVSCTAVGICSLWG